MRGDQVYQLTDHVYLLNMPDDVYIYIVYTLELPQSCWNFEEA